MIGKIKLFIGSIIIQILGFFIKRNDKYLAFGSWNGELYIDNSKYLFEYALNNLSDYKFIWIGDKNLKDYMPNDKRIKLLKKNSISSLIALLKCKNMFCSQLHSIDLSSYNVFRGATIYYLHHGVPVKKWGEDAIGYKKESNINILRRVYRYIIRGNLEYDYFITSSPLHDDANISALKYLGSSVEKNLKTGTPRNDILVNADKELSDKYKKKYSDLLGFDINKKIIMYIPTYRRLGYKLESFLNRSRQENKRLNEILKNNNAIIIEKSHFATKKQNIGESLYSNEHIINLRKKVDLQEMLLFTDILISDYSSCYLDFLMLDRPIIHYVYDYEFYRDIDSGLYYDLDDFTAGEITYTFMKTLDAIENLLKGKDDFYNKRSYVKKNICHMKRV